MKQSKLRNWIYLAAVLATGAAFTGYMTGTEAVQAQVGPNRPPPTARKPLPVTDLQSAVDQTAAVVEGLVTDIQYDYSEEEGPWTRVILSDVHAHFGSAPPEVEIRHFGGPLPNGRMMVAAELPVFVQGKRYVVFLRNTGWNVSPVVGDLALRLETVDDTEVLVNSDGQAVTEVGPEGVAVGLALFGSPELDGTPPKALGMSLAAFDRKPLDRRSFVEALNATMATHGLSIAGDFYDHPAGEFKWRAQRTAPSTRSKAPISTPANRANSPGPEVDMSEPNQ
jgi:hypothetical protein